MQAIKLFVDVDSEDVHIPELKKFIGKKVEMIILEVPSIKPDEEKKQDMKKFWFFRVKCGIRIFCSPFIPS